MLAGAVAAAAAAGVGCQSRLGGVPYPTPYYLKHPPTYLPPDPAFPLQRERDSMLDPTGEIRRGNPAAVPNLGGPPVIGQPVPADPALGK